MENCNKFNQYFTDIVIDGELKCFDGKMYPQGKNFNVNSYKKYNEEILESYEPIEPTIHASL